MDTTLKVILSIVGTLWAANAIISARICGTHAGLHGRNDMLWFWLGFFIGVPALLRLDELIKQEKTI